MDAVLSQEVLHKVFDEAVKEVTEQAAGIRLYSGDAPLDGDLCTVYAAFEKGFHTSLSLCAEQAMLIRLTRNMMQEEQITPDDLEDFTKEYFNVLCGQIAAKLFTVTKIASRFGLPDFHYGVFEPKEFQEHFSIKYTSDENECAKLVHHKQAENAAPHKTDGLQQAGGTQKIGKE